MKIYVRIQSGKRKYRNNMINMMRKDANKNSTEMYIYNEKYANKRNAICNTTV